MRPHLTSPHGRARSTHWACEFTAPDGSCDYNGTVLWGAGRGRFFHAHARDVRVSADGIAHFVDSHGVALAEPPKRLPAAGGGRGLGGGSSPAVRVPALPQQRHRALESTTQHGSTKHHEDERTRELLLYVAFGVAGAAACAWLLIGLSVMGLR